MTDDAFFIVTTTVTARVTEQWRVKAPADEPAGAIGRFFGLDGWIEHIGDVVDKEEDRIVMSVEVEDP